ncbi:MAG: V-type ATP synthase subunit D [Candidatus Lokiarchaeota archaeon]|nr:V-type ATP synthase subunit D [Candidatus Lokiarchaeota archaeon]
MSLGFRKVRPTRPNLQKLEDRKEFTDRGKHLLEIKRQQFLEYLKENMKFYFAQRKITRDKVKKAYQKLLQSYMHYGKRRIQTIAEINKIHYEPSVNVTFKQYLGIYTPSIRLDILEKEKLPSYSFQDTPIAFDDTIDQVKDLLKEIIILAEFDYIVYHFAFNYQKIQRRINALEDIIIPRLEDEIHYIDEILDDLEREEFIRLKKIKNKLEKEKTD